MRAFSAITVLALSLASLQCTQLGPVAGPDEAVGIWGNQPSMYQGGGARPGPGSMRQLLRQVNLRTDIVPKGGRTRRFALPMAAQFITIHSTENTSENATAEQHARAIKSGSLHSVWHFTVDDRQAIQHLPTYEQGIHADINKPGYSAPGNRSSIGIEMCENRGGNLNVTIDRTAKLTAYLRLKNGIPLSRVVPHYHWPRWGMRPPNKNCPHFLMDNGRPGRKWQAFLGRVNYYYRQASQQNSGS
jgi:N-acetylmuramoyl-L-alanine amidase